MEQSQKGKVWPNGSLFVRQLVCRQTDANRCRKKRLFLAKLDIFSVANAMGDEAALLGTPPRWQTENLATDISGPVHRTLMTIQIRLLSSRPGWRQGKGWPVEDGRHTPVSPL